MLSEIVKRCSALALTAAMVLSVGAAAGDA